MACELAFDFYCPIAYRPCPITAHIVDLGGIDQSISVPIDRWPF